jgi:hypothetical protein
MLKRYKYFVLIWTTIVLLIGQSLTASVLASRDNNEKRNGGQQETQTSSSVANTGKGNSEQSRGGQSQGPTSPSGGNPGQGNSEQSRGGQSQGPQSPSAGNPGKGNSEQSKGNSGQEKPIPPKGNASKKNDQIIVHLLGNTTSITKVWVIYQYERLDLESIGPNLYKRTQPDDIVEPDISEIVVEYLVKKETSIKSYSPASDYLLGVEGNGTVNYGIRIASSKPQPGEEEPPIEEEPGEEEPIEEPIEEEPSKEEPESEKPETPGGPVTPVTPGTPGGPVTPVTPGTPGGPGAPEAPETRGGTAPSNNLVPNNPIPNNDQESVLADPQPTTDVPELQETDRSSQGSKEGPQDQPEPSSIKTINGGQLPATSTDWYNLLFASGLLTVVSGGFLWRRWNFGA